VNLGPVLLILEKTIDRKSHATFPLMYVYLNFEIARARKMSTLIWIPALAHTHYFAQDKDTNQRSLPSLDCLFNSLFKPQSPLLAFYIINYHSIEDSLLYCCIAVMRSGVLYRIYWSMNVSPVNPPNLCVQKSANIVV